MLLPRIPFWRRANPIRGVSNLMQAICQSHTCVNALRPVWSTQVEPKKRSVCAVSASFSSRLSRPRSCSHVLAHVDIALGDPQCRVTWRAQRTCRPERHTARMREQHGWSRVALFLSLSLSLPPRAKLPTEVEGPYRPSHRYPSRVL